MIYDLDWETRGNTVDSNLDIKLGLTKSIKQGLLVSCFR